MQIGRSEECGVKPEASGGLAAWLLMRFGSQVRVKFPRMGRARDERRMKLAETLSLGGKRQLMLVVCDGQRYLIGASGEGVETIVALPAEIAGPAARVAKECGS